MDFIATSSYIRHRKMKKEGFDGSATSSSVPTAPVSQHMSNTGSSLFALIIALIAMWLSWSSNTIEGRPFLEKCIWAFLAGIFGTIYILYWILIREPEGRSLSTMQPFIVPM